jgi:hypothetical protein
MSNNPIDEFAKIIAGLETQQANLSENLEGDSENSLLGWYQTEGFGLSGTIKIIRRNLASTSFVLDHPVYGEIDSDTLAIDGGYATSLIGFSMPITMPITFSGTTATSLLYEDNF